MVSLKPLSPDKLARLRIHPLSVETLRLPETAGEVAPLVVLLLLTIVMELTILAPLARLIQLSVEILLPY